MEMSLEDEKAAHDVVLEDLGRSERKLKDAVKSVHESNFSFEQVIMIIL